MKKQYLSPITRVIPMKRPLCLQTLSVTNYHNENVTVGDTED